MTSDQPAPPGDSGPDRPAAVVQNRWPMSVMWMAIVLILVGGAVYVFKSCLRMPGDVVEKTGKLVGQVGQNLEKVAAAFNKGTINTTFTSYATSLSGSEYLQFATLSQHEIFTRTDESSTLFGYLPLPDVIVEARAPVTYTYYLDLNARWEFQIKDGVIWVTAPEIRFNKPAVDASRITYEVKKDSHFRRTSEAIENLKSSITGLSISKAASNIPLVRETGRKQTETFVENWLAKSFADGKSYPVKVRFRNEGGANGSGQGASEAPKQ